MQAYTASFARIYDKHWGDFAARHGQRWLDIYEGTALGQHDRTLLDLCCGTGHLARLALQRGYRVTGLDLSDPMLEHARQGSHVEVASGRARFELADAADFRIEEPVGLVTSTYDALNHLDSLHTLHRCFRCVSAALHEGGTFMFDLNTRMGLWRWSGTNVHETDDLVLILQGSFDKSADRANLHVFGFSRREDSLYERFEENVYNTAFDLDRVRSALLDAGWTSVRVVSVDDLDRELDEPEEEQRVVFIAQKLNP